MIQLRPYQQTFCAALQASYRSGKRRPVGVAPTGAGKSSIMAHAALSHVAKGGRVVVAAHRAELLSQLSKTLDRVGLAHGMIQAGREQDNQAVQVASVQTLVNRLDRMQAPTLFVVDECHHGVSPTYRRIFESWPDAYSLGLTATPERLDGKGLGAVFDDIVRGPEVSDLMRDGWLTRPTYFCPPGKPQEFRVVRGDFDREETEAAMDRPTITGDAVREYAKHCPGAPAIAFCVSLKHAAHTCEAFKAAGFRAACIDGTNTASERENLIASLGDGRLHVLISVELIGEGVDVPVVACGILLRPTNSLTIHLQQIGRCLRPADGKSRAVILDHAGNVQRHGLAEDRREWSLEGGAESRSRETLGEPAARLVQCPSCYAVAAPSDECGNCGHVFTAQARKIRTAAGELIELPAAPLPVALNGKTLVQCARPGCGFVHADAVDTCPKCAWDYKQAARIERARAQTPPELIALAKSRGYKNPGFWAMSTFRARSKKSLVSKT